MQHIVRLEDEDATQIWLSKSGLEWLLCNASDAVLSHSGTAGARSDAEASSSAAERPPVGAPIWRADGRETQLPAEFAMRTRHAKVTPHAPWAEYYSPVACEVIARRFAVDFEAFGYDVSECAARLRRPPDRRVTL